MMAPPSDRRSGVNRSLTPKRRKRVTENDEYAAFLTRVLRAYSRRIATGDIDALTAMATLATDLDHAMTEAITELRARHGYSWADIGTRLGITRQAAQQRWGTAPGTNSIPGHDHRQPQRCGELPVTPTGPTLAPAPGPHHGPGTGANAAPGFPGIFDPWQVHARDSAFIRARDGYLATIRHDPGPPEYFAASDLDPDAYDRWLDHIWPAAGCTHPIRLGGQIHRIDPATGEILTTTPTSALPDGVIYKACGNRRTSACPSCAETYRRDAFQLLRAGLIGGKGVPEHVCRSPGRVRHLHRPLLRPRPHPPRPGCTPAPAKPTAPANRSPATPAATPKPARTAASWPASPATAATTPGSGSRSARTATTTPPHVVWNNNTGELWRRTKQAIERHLNQLARRRGPRPTASASPTAKPPNTRPAARSTSTSCSASTAWTTTTPPGSCPRPPASPSPTSKTPPGTPPPPSPT